MRSSGAGQSEASECGSSRVLRVPGLRSPAGLGRRLSGLFHRRVSAETSLTAVLSGRASAATWRRRRAPGAAGCRRVARAGPFAAVARLGGAPARATGTDRARNPGVGVLGPDLPAPMAGEDVSDPRPAERPGYRRTSRTMASSSSGSVRGRRPAHSTSSEYGVVAGSSPIVIRADATCASKS